jgi:hypothetical protein
MGAFHQHSHQWMQEGTPPTLLHWIHLGVPLPIWQLPALHALRNHHLSPNQEEFIKNKISHLVQEQALQELLPHEQAFLSPIRVVPKKNRKHRLIINMKLLNFYIWLPKFKFSSLCELAPLLQVGDWLITLDFHDGFHHVEVLPKHQFLLGLWWRHQQYTFWACPFGLNASPWIFT